MSGLMLAGIIAGVTVIVLTIVGFTISRLYVRTKKGMAFIRTGFGGEKVVKDGGAMVLPVLHEISWADMKTRKIVVERRAESSLITKDNYRVDIKAEFYLRVKNDAPSISTAAQSIGEALLKDDVLKQLMEGKFVDTLRGTAVSFTMDDLRINRESFVQQVQKIIAEELDKNGIELETVALTDLNQTDIQYFDENNAFDAEGLTSLRKNIEENRKKRNDVERENQVLIAQKNLEAEKRQQEIKQQEELIKAETEKSIKIAQAQREKEAREVQIKTEQEIQKASIEAEQAVKSAQIETDKRVKEADILAKQAVEIANQQMNIAVAEKSKEESVAQAKANTEKAKAVQAEEAIKTAQETEIANREKAIAIIEAEQIAGQDAVKIKVAAEAEREASEAKAKALEITASAEANAITLKAEAHKAELLAEAEGQQKLNEAQNSLNPEIVRMNVQVEVIRNAAGIIAAMNKPMESINDFKVVNVNGLGNGGTGTGNMGIGNTQSSGSFVNDLFNGLSAYQTTVPVISDILKSAGINASSPSGILEGIKDVVGEVLPPQD